MVLSYFRSGFNRAVDGYHREAAVVVNGAENHTLAVEAAELASGEIGYENHLLPKEILGLIVLSDAAQYLALLQTIVDEESE